jgi:hypothetical protein
LRRPVGSGGPPIPLSPAFCFVLLENHSVPGADRLFCWCYWEMGGEMTHIGKEHGIAFARWPRRLAVTALMYALLSAGLWSGIGWAQEPAPQEGVPFSLLQTEVKKLSRTPAAKSPSSPKPTSVVAPGRDTTTGGTLATALATCDKRIHASRNEGCRNLAEAGCRVRRENRCVTKGHGNNPGNSSDHLHEGSVCAAWW